MKKIFYFCNVKSNPRHEVAALKQRFLCPQNGNSKRIDWVNGNVPKASADLSLTSRNALSFINV